MDIIDFKKKFYGTERAGFGFGLPIAAAYAVILTKMPEEQIPLILIMLSTVAVLDVFLIGFPLSYLIIKKPAVMLAKKDLANNQEKILLFKELHKVPFRQGIALFARVAIGTIIAGLILYFKFHLSGYQAVLAVLFAMFGSYLSGLYGYFLTDRLINPILLELETKIEFAEEEIRGRTNFGLSFVKNNFYFVIIPVVYTTILFYLTVDCSLYLGDSLSTLRFKLISVIIINLTSNVIMSLFITRSNKKSLHNIIDNLNVIAFTSGNLNVRNKTSIKNEMEYIMYLLNVSFKTLGSMIKKIQANNYIITDASLSLSSMSDEMSTTSNEQAAAVSEIVTTMEDSTKLAEEVAVDIKEIDSRSGNINKNVDSGFNLIEENRVQMEMIKEADKETVVIVDSLNSQIKSIWEVVNIITSIANQTKIIAFNAELEATAAGEAGENFQIVATEVRRLADSTVDSTEKIKQTISEIQEASESLNSATQVGSRRIDDGLEITEKLKLLMEELKDIASSTNAFAGSIYEKTEQQVCAFQQIFQTLKQISSGVTNFAESTIHITENTKSMSELIEELDNSINKFTV